MRPVPVREFRHSHPHPVGESPSSSQDGRPPTLELVASAAPFPCVGRAFDPKDAHALLGLCEYHFAHLPAFAPSFADLRRELRFSDLGKTARAAFIWEAVTCLRSNGPTRARDYCRRATAQLQHEHAARHSERVDNPVDETRSIEDPIGDAEAAYWREAHKWGA